MTWPVAWIQPLLLTIATANAGSAARSGQIGPAQHRAAPPGATQSSFGLTLNNPKAYQGYTLFAPLFSTKTYLIDMQGRSVHAWESDCLPGQSAYLLEDGHLLRAGHLAEQPAGFGPIRGGGRVQEFTWQGDLVWDYQLVSDTQLPHHDLCKIPNGNVLLIVAEKKSADEAAAAGRKGGALLADCLLEVKPTGKTTGRVVWEWHVWDHLVQDHDKTKANYGDVAAHPERIDVNYAAGTVSSLIKNKDDLAKLRALGYVAGPTAAAKSVRGNLDWNWTHTNSVAYHAERDQILLSVRGFSEIWVIDHSTTKAEAAGHSGGRYGKGGDLLYRWGNPRAYRAGSVKDQQLFFQHDAQWIPRGLPGEGHVLVFNNGVLRPAGAFSSVDEIVLPADARGQFLRQPGTPFGPALAGRSYTAPEKTSFFSMIMGGAQRLPNGNTLVCASTAGTLFEVTADGEVVWKYVVPPPRRPSSCASSCRRLV